MESFQYSDEKGFNWGLAVRKKSERIMNLLERESLLKEERDRAGKLSREIQGFGSFSDGTSASRGILQESPLTEAYGKSHTLFSSQEKEEEEQTNTRKLKPSQIAEAHKDLKENTVPSKEKIHKWTGIEESSQCLGGMIDDDHRREIVAEEDHPFTKSDNQTTHSLIF